MTRHPGGRTCNGGFGRPFVWLVLAASALINFRRKR